MMTLRLLAQNKSIFLRASSLEPTAEEELNFCNNKRTKATHPLRPPDGPCDPGKEQREGAHYLNTSSVVWRRTTTHSTEYRITSPLLGQKNQVGPPPPTPTPRALSPSESQLSSSRRQSDHEKRESQRAPTASLQTLLKCGNTQECLPSSVVLSLSVRSKRFVAPRVVAFLLDVVSLGGGPCGRWSQLSVSPTDRSPSLWT